MKLNTIDKILITLASFVFGFTITMIVIFCIYQVTPDTLIECVFACCSSESVITFAIWWIKKKANRKDKDNDREVKKP
jgi:hypothetical protein